MLGYMSNLIAIPVTDAIVATTAIVTPTLKKRPIA